MAINRVHQTASAPASLLTAGLLLVVALVGCSPADAGSGAKTTPGAGPASAPATSAPAKGRLDGVPAACPSAAVVMSNLHLTSLVVSGDPSICEYLFKGNKSSPYAAITFNANPGITPAKVKASLKQGQTDVQDVPGLGDAAFSFASDRGKGLTFLSGGTICSIDTTVPTTIAAEVALARAILQG
ncbi:MAG TPA: hypothetical protein VGM14_26155 [Streptosporangiaceae bacterium]